MTDDIETHLFGSSSPSPSPKNIKNQHKNVENKIPIFINLPETNQSTEGFFSDLQSRSSGWKLRAIQRAVLQLKCNPITILCFSSVVTQTCTFFESICFEIF